MGKKLITVMLIDDDDGTNYFHQLIINKTDCAEQVLVYEEVSKAIAYLNTTTHAIPELILLDLNMPVMDGWDFLKSFKEIKQNLKVISKIIVLSSSVNPLDMERALANEDVTDYLSKPLSILTLKTILQNHFKD